MELNWIFLLETRAHCNSKYSPAEILIFSQDIQVKSHTIFETSYMNY